MRPEGAPTSAAAPRGRVAPPKKKKAVLVRVPEGGQYIDTYRTTVTLGRAALTQVRAVKRTRLGHVLLELAPKVSSAAVANELTRLTSGKCRVPPSRTRRL